MATRKTVTVLFADIVDSTGLGERFDPESLRRVIGRYFDEARTALERHGGTLEKYIGDAVVATFGIPVAREDDALRALCAAAELRTAARQERAQSRAREAVALYEQKGDVVSAARARERIRPS